MKEGEEQAEEWRVSWEKKKEKTGSEDRWRKVFTHRNYGY